MLYELQLQRTKWPLGVGIVVEITTLISPEPITSRSQIMVQQLGSRFSIEVVKKNLHLFQVGGFLPFVKEHGIYGMQSCHVFVQCETCQPDQDPALGAMIWQQRADYH